MRFMRYGQKLKELQSETEEDRFRVLSSPAPCSAKVVINGGVCCVFSVLFVLKLRAQQIWQRKTSRGAA